MRSFLVANPLSSQPQSNFRCVWPTTSTVSPDSPSFESAWAFQNNVNNVKCVKILPLSSGWKDPSGEKVTFWVFACITWCRQLLPHWLMPTSPYGRLCSQASAIGETISLGLALRNIRPAIVPYFLVKMSPCSTELDYQTKNNACFNIPSWVWLSITSCFKMGSLAGIQILGSQDTTWHVSFSNADKSSNYVPYWNRWSAQLW